MTDLDARVAALMALADKHASSGMQITADQFVNRKDPTQARCDHLADYEALEQAIRAELQKPALHEPIADEEITLALNIANGRLPDGAGQRSRMRRALGSFLQGRAKPALTFNLGDIVRKKKGAEWEGTIVGTYSTRLTPEGYSVESASHAGSVQIYPVSALELMQNCAKPAQEEITDAERYRFLRANAAISDGRPFIAKSSMGGISQWTEIHADEQVDAAIRASKGEKP